MNWLKWADMRLIILLATSFVNPNASWADSASITKDNWRSQCGDILVETKFNRLKDKQVEELVNKVGENVYTEGMHHALYISVATASILASELALAAIAPPSVFVTVGGTGALFFLSGTKMYGNSYKRTTQDKTKIVSCLSFAKDARGAHHTNKNLNFVVGQKNKKIDVAVAPSNLTGTLLGIGK